MHRRPRRPCPQPAQGIQSHRDRRAPPEPGCRQPPACRSALRRPGPRRAVSDEHAAATSAAASTAARSLRCGRGRRSLNATRGRVTTSWVPTVRLDLDMSAPSVYVDDDTPAGAHEDCQPVLRRGCSSPRIRVHSRRPGESHYRRGLWSGRPLPMPSLMSSEPPRWLVKRLGGWDSRPLASGCFAWATTSCWEASTTGSWPESRTPTAGPSSITPPTCAASVG